MRIKQILETFIKDNRYLVLLSIKLRNDLKLKQNSLAVENLHFCKNKISIMDKNSKLLFSKESFMRNSIVSINGNDNLINIDCKTTLYGENEQTIYIDGKGNKINIGSNCKLTRARFFIRGNNNIISIGNNCSAYNVEFHVEQNDNKILIKNNTSMHGREGEPIHMAVDEGSKIIIGNDCMLSNGIQIRSTDSHSIIDKEFKRLNPAKDVIINDHCWIGLKCILLKGTCVYGHSVIAAGSVCSKRYDESNCIIAGNPARIVKHDIDWDRKFV